VTASILALVLSSAANGRGVEAPLPSLPRQGAYPIERPQLEGVDALSLLSSRWLVLVVSDLAAVYREIDALSTGALSRAIADWSASEAAGRPNWTAYRLRDSLRQRYGAGARERAGERRLDEPGFFAISGDDPAYARPRPPSRVSRAIVGLGGNRLGPARAAMRGLGAVYYAHYVYLKFP
jgi:hypothetical protein